MKTKQSIFALAVVILMTGAVMTSCNTPTQKVENAQDNVIESKKELDQANQEYMADIEKFRKEKSGMITVNNQRIAEFKAGIKNQNEAVKSDFNQKIAELEHKNSEMKKKLDDYKMEGKEKWEIFKSEFNSNMDELGKAFNDLTAKI
jgi:F0F1-type ATP synthase membrane subunit b/b'